MVRHELLNAALGWGAIVVAAVNGVAGVLLWTVSSYSTAAVAVIFGGLLGFAAVVLIASVMMLRQPEAARGEARRPVFATA
jgi:high-affinity Fe2+/Pb2+ permease